MKVDKKKLKASQQVKKKLLSGNKVVNK